MHKVMIFPCGSQVAQEVSDSLYCRRDVYLIGVGSRDCPAYGSYDEVRHIGSSVGDRYLARDLLRVSREVGAECLFACNDSAHLQISGSCAKSILVGSSHATSKTLSLKSSTYSALRAKLPVPITGRKVSPPAFVKPDRGSGSKGCWVAESRSELRRVREDELACELVSGEEFTTDCFTDRSGRLLVCSSRRRDEIRSGMSVRTSMQADPGLRHYAEVINDTFDLRGGWFFQTIRRASGEHVVIEVNPRIASCSGATRASGANLALMSMMDHLGVDVEPSICCEVASQTKIFHNSVSLAEEFSELFVDFDDCLLLRHGLNSGLLRLIFDCKNRGKRVSVISKHRGNLAERLRRLGIDRIFDRVIHLKHGESKSKHLHRGALLVDDSFRERQEASATCQCLSPDVFTNGELVF